MLGPITTTLQGVIDITWPMVLIACVVIVSLRLSYLIKNRERVVLYNELLSLIVEMAKKAYEDGLTPEELEERLKAENEEEKRVQD